MTDLRTLTRHVGHYLGGRAGLVLLGFISFPIFTRLLTVEQYGEISLVFKVVVCLIVFAKLGVQNSVVRFFQDSQEKRDPPAVERFYSTFFFGGSGLAVLVSALVFAALWFIPRRLLPENLRTVLLWAIVLMLVRALWSLLSSFFQAEGRTIVYNCFDLGMKAGTIAAICVSLWLWGRTVLAYLSATIVVEVIAAGIALGILARRKVLRFAAVDLRLLRSAILFGLPLAVYEIASVVLDSGDRLLVLHYLGRTQLGYYTAAYNLSSYTQISIIAPVNLAIIPIYMRLWKERGEAETQAFLRRSLDLFSFGAIALCMVGALVSAPVMVTLASAKYSPAAQLVPLLIVGMLIYATHIFLTPGLLIYKRTGMLARQVVYASGLNLILNIILLPRMGIMGGAWATVLSYAFLIVAIGRVSQPLFRVAVPWRAVGLRLVVALCVYGVARLALIETHGSHPILASAGVSFASVLMYLLVLGRLDGTAHQFLQTALRWIRVRYTPRLIRPETL